MKKIILILILVGITFLGCNDNLDNTIISSPTETDKLTNPEPSIYPPLFVSKLIDGEIGGVFILDSTYINSQGREINVYARLKFPAGSFQGTINITMAPKDADLSIQLFPEMKFAEIVKLDLVFSGIDLKAFGYTTNGHVDFAYFDDNGGIELIETNGSQVIILHQRIALRGGKLSHFSRYGWIR